jgi:SAM-dependent methyltransferase
VLEAGCGIGTDGVRFAAAGADYTGFDFSAPALRLARRRFSTEGLPGSFAAGSIPSLPFPDESFDLVFSHGVIHHIDDTKAAVREFHRVLRPGGTALVMVYHRASLNYRVSIMGIRRAMALFVLVPGAAKAISRLTGEPEEIIAGHRQLFTEYGLRYVRDRQLFLNHNTDGPGNPLAKVYSDAELRALMTPEFEELRTQVRYLNARLYPGGQRLAASRTGDRLERRVGWHLYVEGRKRGGHVSN